MAAEWERWARRVKVIYDGRASGEARTKSWDYCRIALNFFREHKVPFWDTHIDIRRNRRTIISSHVRGDLRFEVGDGPSDWSQNVVGRDRLIEQIWKKLESKSLRLTAERRIGKTTVMKKMVAEPRPGTAVLFLDLEKADSPRRFTEVLLQEVKPCFRKNREPPLG